MTATETLDERADRLLSVGLDIAVRIRDEDPHDVARALAPLERAELRDLTILLGACIDLEKPAPQLVSWFAGDYQPPPPPRARRQLHPHGHHLRYRQHLRNPADPPCVACTAAHREYDRDRKAAWRAAGSTGRQGIPQATFVAWYRRLSAEGLGLRAIAGRLDMTYEAARSAHRRAVKAGLLPRRQAAG